MPRPFMEVETPVLIKSTPGYGPGDFVVLQQDSFRRVFYALPQSPQDFQAAVEWSVASTRIFKLLNVSETKISVRTGSQNLPRIDCGMSLGEQRGYS